MGRAILGLLVLSAALTLPAGESFTWPKELAFPSGASRTGCH